MIDGRTLLAPRPTTLLEPVVALLLAAGFVAAFLLGEEVTEAGPGSSDGLHAVVALVTTAVAGWHLLRHRAWLARVFSPRARLAQPQRIRRVGVVVLGVAFTFMVVTGMLSSRFLGMDPSSVTTGLHHLSSKLTLLVVLWHLVLCRHQIGKWFRRPRIAKLGPAGP